MFNGTCGGVGYYGHMLLAQVAATVASSAPWWGIPAFTLGGAIGGAALAQAISYVNSRKGEVNSKREAYVATIRELASKYSSTLYECRYFLVEGQTSQRRALQSSYTDLIMIAPAPIVTPAAMCLVSVDAMYAAHNSSSQNVEAHQVNYVSAHSQFVGAVRDWLGLEPSPPINWA